MTPNLVLQVYCVYDRNYADSSQSGTLKRGAADGKSMNVKDAKRAKLDEYVLAQCCGDGS